MFDLKRLRKEKKLKQGDIADILQCGQPNISAIENEGKDLTPEQMDLLISKYGKEYILGFYSESSQSLISNSTNQPILDIRVSAGHGVGLEGIENQVTEWVNIPKFEGCYGVMVYGDSMYDRFKSGDVVFVRPIRGRSDFDFGQCYVIITNEDRYLKNVYESPKGVDYITMTSFNIELNPDGRRKYPDRDIHIDEIKHLYKVAGKLRRDQL